MTALNRALGAFYGLALGDALGMPTQSLNRERSRRASADHRSAGRRSLQPIAANMPKGSITDDTEQAILVGQLLIEGKGRIEPACSPNG
jgi:ADP-ribosylglycohydrolase